MLIDSLRFALERRGAWTSFWGKLDAAGDGTLGVANSARPFLVAARFSHRPQNHAGGSCWRRAAITFARSLSAYLGEDKGVAFSRARRCSVCEEAGGSGHHRARRMEAAHALQTGRQVVVVASARALLRMLPPAEAKAAAPMTFAAGFELATCRARQAGINELDDLIHALEARGFANTGGLMARTFCTRGGNSSTCTRATLRIRCARFLRRREA